MSNIRVAVRVRPLNKKEKDEGSKEIIQVKGDTVSIENVKLLGISEIADSRERIKHFMFDHCYDCMAGDSISGTASQAIVFQDLGTEVLQAAFDGFNACVFAYGQTGTGKTYTMMGQEEDVGLIPRICEGLFSHVADCADDNVTCRIDISYYEIYNERVRDLLQPELLKQNEKYSLKVREHPKEGPYVKDLSWHRVKDNDEIQALLDTGNDHRVTAETYMHDHSSRSHAIVTICFTQARLEENRPSEIVSKVHLVDLAGSERADPSSKPGFRKRLTEGSNINRSLVTLGYVIKTLAEKSLLSWSTEDMGSIQNFQSSGGGESMATSSPSGPNKQRLPYIPYRDSVLTWLLKDSLGGNSKTIMIATITAASQYYSETISTLRYAQRAKNIINKPRINEDANVALIRELRREIERLHNMLAEAQSSGNLLTLPDSEDSMIAERLHENEEMAKQLTQSWMCKWSSTHDIMKESDLSIRGLRNRTSSMGVMIDSQLPYLVAMDDDILSTGVCIFHLKEGETLIGREDADREQDIVLPAGPNIEKEHCFIQNLDGAVTLVPNLGAMCAVQGLEVTEPTRLSQGDYIVLGGSQVFRFNNPTEAAKLREHRRSQGSLSNLSASRLSFGGLSRASSYSSIMSEDHGYLSPHSQYLKSSYPNYADADLCMDLERRYKTESERIEEAKNELQTLIEQHEKSEELRQEKEEQMYQLHDQHRQEIEDQRHHLAQLIEENQRARQKAEEELELARESLTKEKEAFQRQLNEERERLRELSKQESLAVQTDHLQTSSIATDPDLEVFSQGTQGDLRKAKYSGGRKLSVEEQLQELEELEFERKLSYRETEQSLSIQQEDLEDRYNSTQDQIEAKMEKIKQIEEQYKELDKTHLKEISDQKEKIESLRKKETELEVYIEEKEDLLKVKTDVPRPLRNAASEMFLLNPDLQDLRYPQKTTSLSDIQAGINEGSGGEKTPLSASTESLKSLVSPVAMEIAGKPMETARSKNEHVKRKREPEDKHSKISTVAKDVTSRLYQPPEPKFKYVPKSKEKEIKTAPVRPRIPKERDPDAIGRGSPPRVLRDRNTRHSPSPLRDVSRTGSDSPARFVRNTDKRHSPSPLRQSPSSLRHSPSPVRNTGRKSSPSPSKGKGKLGDNSPVPDKERKPLKKVDSKAVKDTEKKDEEQVVARTSKKESPIMAVRNKAPVDNTSALIDLKMRRSPDRLGVASNRLGGTSPLRQMASASSLASVPESLHEEDSGPLATSTSLEPLVKKRNRKGRALLDEDEFRRHSAPDYDKLENEFNAYSKQMMGFHPGEKEYVSVSPTYRTSVSVDESELQNSHLEEESDTAHTDTADKGVDSETQTIQDQMAKEQVHKFYFSSGDELTPEETENIKEPTECSISEIPVEIISDQGGRNVDQMLSDDGVVRDKSIADTDDTKSDTVLIGMKRDHVDGPKPENLSVSLVKKSKSDKYDTSDGMQMPADRHLKKEHDESFSNDSLDEGDNADSMEVTSKVTHADRLTQSLPHDLLSLRENCAKSVSDDSLEEMEDEAKEHQGYMDLNAETEVSESVENAETDMDVVINQNGDILLVEVVDNSPLQKSENNQVDMSDSEETDFQFEEPEKFVVTLDIKNDEDMFVPPLEDTNNLVSSEKDDVNNEHWPENQTSPNEEAHFEKLKNVNVVSSSLAKDMVDELVHEELEVHLALEGETKLTHEEIEVELKLEGESCVLTPEHKLDSSSSDNNNDTVESEHKALDIKTESTKYAEDKTIDMKDSQLFELDTKSDTHLESDVENRVTNITNDQNVDLDQNQITANVTFENEQKLKSEDVITDDLQKPVSDLSSNQSNNESGKGTEIDDKTRIESASHDNDRVEEIMEISETAELEIESSFAVGSSDRDRISATEIFDNSRTIAVWTSQEYIADMDDGGEGVGGQGSDDSLLDPSKELKVLQEALEQLPAKSSSKDGPQLSTARRAARQRAMIRKEQRTTESDGVSAQSDESPTSGNLSKSSSRPGSGSRRRRRPNGRGLAQPVSEHTTDEYASSDSDSLYSDDSLKECSDRLGERGNLVNGTSGNPRLENIRPSDLEISEAESVEMLPQQLRSGSGRRSIRLDRQTNGVEITSFDGARSVGIQTSRSDRIHSSGSTRTGTSDEFDISFASGDLSGIVRNMIVSPLSLWSNNDRRESDSSDQNSSSSAGVKVRLSEADRSMTPTPRSSARSSTSVFSFRSNLDKGPTEVWSSSASDLRKLPGFSEELGYVIETEGMWPGQSSLDYSEDAQSLRSFNVRTPIEGERLSPRPGSSTPRPGSSTPRLRSVTPNGAKTAAKIVHVTFPDGGQSVNSEAFCLNAPVKYQVTIHEDNTNILYNVDKTEYKTYSLRNQSDTQPPVIPDTIHVNLTESVTSEKHEKFESNAKEDIVFQKPDNKEESGDDSLILERSFRSSCSSERELSAENGAIPQETYKELTQKDDQQTFQVPMQKADAKDKKKKVELHQSGIIANTDYPGDEEGATGGDKESLADESDTTSDYGTFTSIDGRKGLVTFTSDSEDGDTASPGISPRASHVSARHIESDLVEPTVQKSLNQLNQLPEQSNILETSEETTEPLVVDGQQLCSVQEVVNQPVIVARLQSSSPTEIVQSESGSLNENELNPNQNQHETPMQMSVNEVTKVEPSKPDHDNLMDDTECDTGSLNTLGEKSTNKGDSKMGSRETLDSVETVTYDNEENKMEDENVERKFNEELNSEPEKNVEGSSNSSPTPDEQNRQRSSPQTPSLSPRPVKDYGSSISSNDEIYLSLEKLETSTSSSDYQTPQQSPAKEKEESISRLVTDVEIPDIDSDTSSLSPTPRQSVLVTDEHRKVHEQEEPRPETAMAVRTVSVNTEAVSLVSHSPAITQQTFFDETDPAYTEKMRKELEKKIATLTHKERSLSDSAISSDFTDGDSSPRGSRFYDSGKLFGESHLRHIGPHARLQGIYNAAQSPSHESGQVTFDAPSVKKSLFADSGNVYDHEDDEKDKVSVEKDEPSDIYVDTNSKAKGTDDISLSENKAGQYNQVPNRDVEKRSLISEKALKLQVIPPLDAIERFPERLSDAVLAIKPYSYPRSVSLDGLSTLVNVDTHLSRAVRNIPSEELGSSNSQASETVQKYTDRKESDPDSQKSHNTRLQHLDHNQNFMQDNVVLNEGRPLSPGEIIIRPESCVENKIALECELRSRIKGKSTSMSDLEPERSKRVPRSLSEANIDDFEENDTSSSSSDSITFVFVDKNNKHMEHVINIDDDEICMQDAEGYEQGYPQTYADQNDYDQCGDYSGSESQSPDSKLYSGSESQSPDFKCYSESESQSPDSKLYSGSESQSPDIRIYVGQESQSPDSRPYSVTESQSPDSRPVSGLAPSGTESEDYLYDMNTGEKIVYRDGFPGGLQSEEVSGRTNSRHSDNCEAILDESSSDSSSEENEEIMKINGADNQIGGSREISVRLENDSPPTYTEPSDEQTQSDGLDQNVTNSGSVDDKPLRHKFGIDESVLPIPERAVSADNLPKHKIKFKDIQRSRSADMVEVGGATEQESEEGIFPPARVQGDDDQTDPSISLRTMSEGGIDPVSQRTVSELGITYSSRTSSELDSVTSDSDSSIAKVKADHNMEGTSDSSEEEYQEEITIEYAKTYQTDRMPDNEPGMVQVIPAADDSRRSPSTASEGEVDPSVLRDDEHIREVLRTVEKFIMPKQVLVDHATSTDDENCSRFVSVGVQTSAVDSETQTAESNPIHVNPDQIILPALAAPFRAQSMDSFGLGANQPRLVLSEGSDNWYTLGQLMVETTNLLRRINERLPDIENRRTPLPSSEESQAILKKWQEISIQTGYSLADLTTVGLQTDGALTGLRDMKSIQSKLLKSNAESTQIDKQFKMEPLEVSEVVTSDLLPGPAERIASEMSVQTDPELSEVSSIAKIEQLVQSEKDNAAADQTISETSKASKLQPDSLAKYQQDPNIYVPSSQTLEKEPWKVVDTTHTDEKLVLLKVSEKQAIPSKISSSENGAQPETTFKPDGTESVLKTQIISQQVETPVYRSRQTASPLKQKVTLPLQSVDDEPPNTSISTAAKPAILSANSTEIEALRKEHAKLIENLRNASASRTDRQEKIKTRKHVPEHISKDKDSEKETPTAADASGEEIKQDDRFGISETVARAKKSIPKPPSPQEIMESSDLQETVKTKAQDTVSPLSPQEIVKVKIQMCPRSGVKVENTTYVTEEEMVKVEKKRKGILHEHIWQLAGDGNIMTVSEEKPDFTSDRSRTTSNTSLSSEGTIEAEIIKAVAGCENMADPVEYAAARAGALNPLFKNENDVIDDVLGHDIIKPEKKEFVEAQPVIEKMIKKLIVKPEIFYGDSAEMYAEPEIMIQSDKRKQPGEDVKTEKGQENDIPVFLPAEESIVPKIYKRDNALPSKFPTRHPSSGKAPGDTLVPVVEPSIDRREKSVVHQPVKSEISPKFKTPALQWSPSTSAEKQAGFVPQPLVRSTALSPVRKSAPRFGQSDDSTQVSMEFSDDFTQTDPDTSAETVIQVNTGKDREKRRPESSQIVPSKVNTVSNRPAKASPEISNSMTRELERLQNERGEIMELLSLNYLPTSLTVELLEAKLNYCIGQTDLLLGSLDENFKPSDRSRGTAVDQQFAKEYIAKYRSDLKKSKQDILICRERLNMGIVGSGRGRPLHRNRDLYHSRRLAQIEAFRLERMREQQDYERSRCSTPVKGNTPLRGNTPLKGNSPIATPRSNISRDSSPDYSPAYMTPKEHKDHYTDLRKQLIRNVLDEERQHTRSCSPTLLGHHPGNRQLDASFGFSPKVSVSVSNGLDKEDVRAYTVAPGTYTDSPRTSSMDRYPHLSANYYQHQQQMHPQHKLDTKMMAESIFSPQESEQILREIQEIQRRTQTSPREEIPRTSSFSSTHSRGSVVPARGGLSPGRHSTIPGPRHRSQSPVSRHSESLSLNLESLHDSRHSDLEDTRPYSPYSAYAREHIIPNERPHDHGVLRGSYELYDSMPHDRSHDRAHDRSHDGTHDPDGCDRSGLDGQRLNRLRPVSSADVKARLGRHKR